MATMTNTELTKCPHCNKAIFIPSGSIWYDFDEEDRSLMKSSFYCMKCGKLIDVTRFESLNGFVGLDLSKGE